MQGLPSKTFQDGAGGGGKQAGLGLEAGAVAGVAQDRMPDMGQMHSNLVGAAGLQGASQQAGDRLAVGADRALERLPMGYRLAAAFAHSAFVARLRMTVERSVDGAFRAGGRAPDQGEIAALDAAVGLVGELGAERAMGGVGLSNDHEAGGVLVEPVHDAGPLHAADAGQAVAAMGDQRIEQRASGVAGGGVHDQAPRFVYHDQRVVFIDDVKRDRLAPRVWALRRRARVGNSVAGFDVAGGIADRARRDRY